MIFSIIGDPHITPKNLDKAKQLFDYVEELGRTTIWLGDMFDTKEIIRGKCLNFVYEALRKSKISHIILVGNHDWFNLQCEEHALEVLKQLPNVVVIDKPSELPMYQNLYFIPYMNDQKEFKKVLKNTVDKTVFVHQDVKGFDYGNGHKSTDGVTLGSFNKCHMVIAGHFHKYQTKGKLTYLGTPFSQNYGESNQTKFIAQYDTDTRKIEFFKTQFPQHYTLTINCDSEVVDPDDVKAFVNNYVRVILIGKQENINKFDRSPFDILETVKWLEKPSDSFLADINIDETADNITQFKNWALDIKQINPKTVELGIDILQRLK